MTTVTNLKYFLLSNSDSLTRLDFMRQIFCIDLTRQELERQKIEGRYFCHWLKTNMPHSAVYLG